MFQLLKEQKENEILTHSWMDFSGASSWTTEVDGELL